MDLSDLEHKTRVGLHIASLGGAWSALVVGFGGVRPREGSLAFAPRLPEDIARLTFRVLFRNRRICVEVTATDAKYHLLEGSTLPVWHPGDTLALSTNEAVTLPIPRIKAGPRPAQSPWRLTLE